MTPERTADHKLSVICMHLVSGWHELNQWALWRFDGAEDAMQTQCKVQGEIPKVDFFATNMQYPHDIKLTAQGSQIYTLR